MMEEVRNRPEGRKQTIKSFSHFDKQGSGLVDIEEMKHVLTKVGDVLSPEES